jgi:YlmC/YmxH family sporulation protein
MEISFADLKEKEIINVYDGKKLGRIADILFDGSSGSVQGIVVPYEKKLFRKSDDIFIPLEKIKKIGDDVILVGLQVGGEREDRYESFSHDSNSVNAQNASASKNKTQKYGKYAIKGQSQSNNSSYIRFRRVDSKKYR